MPDLPAKEQLLQRVSALGKPFGREDSFKLAHQRLLDGRVLIGIETRHMLAREFFALALELGMPAQCQALLQPHCAQANAFFFGVEERVGACVTKVYLEFWDHVRHTVRTTGSLEPQLLHLGVKWDSARPNRHELARYLCHPLLSARDVLRRMAALYPKLPDGPQPVAERPGSSRLAAQGIVQQGLKRNPGATLLYLEASESGNPRQSFDVNLYKTGLLVGDVATELHAAATHFELNRNVLNVQLEALGHCPLGHISGGTDRCGGEFLSIYGEIQAL